jgi:hypothetical protein
MGRFGALVTTLGITQSSVSLNDQFTFLTLGIAVFVASFHASSPIFQIIHTEKADNDYGCTMLSSYDDAFLSLRHDGACSGEPGRDPRNHPTATYILYRRLRHLSCCLRTA